jgi:hypothetical protein
MKKVPLKGEDIAKMAEGSGEFYIQVGTDWTKIFKKATSFIAFFYLIYIPFCILINAPMETTVNTVLLAPMFYLFGLYANS